MSTTLWQNLVTAALLGTERQAFILPTVDGALGQLIAQIDPNDQESALLSIVTAVAMHQRAGCALLMDQSPLAIPCEPDDMPRCCPSASHRLASMLSGEHQEVLPEWLTLLVAAEQRVAEENLPALLEWGSKQPDSQIALLKVIGNRGRWLAVQNPDWAYAISSDEDDIWQNGSRSARELLIRRLRISNPDRGRELVISTWKEEPAATRAAFLELFQIGLSMADEPFLEQALDDRRKEVRREAANLLSCLPESRLCQRITELARSTLALLKLSNGKKLELIVTPPDTCTAIMSRDGINPTPPSGRGEKAWWLLQILSIVPPATWCETWHVTPAALIEAVQDSEWRTNVIQGWTAAAAKHKDAKWAEALYKAKAADYTATLPILPPERRESLILEALSWQSMSDDQTVLMMLEYHAGPWIESFSRAVLDRLHEHVTQNTVNYQLHSLLKHLAYCIPPSLADEAEAALTPAEDQKIVHWWTTALTEMIALLRFRYEMQKEFIR